MSIQIHSSLCSRGCGLCLFSADGAYSVYICSLETRTHRWTTYDAVLFGVDLHEDVLTSQQGRACTSPIWYLST
ncbi:MAG: DUF3604 domain-containing protein [Thiotrichales bacterium]|nr:MAG: DUF3604 domain-containing protein [Thiotrichales bacterium]